MTKHPRVVSYNHTFRPVEGPPKADHGDELSCPEEAPSWRPRHARIAAPRRPETPRYPRRGNIVVGTVSARSDDGYSVTLSDHRCEGFLRDGLFHPRERIGPGTTCYFLVTGFNRRRALLSRDPNAIAPQCMRDVFGRTDKFCLSVKPDGTGVLSTTRNAIPDKASVRKLARAVRRNILVVDANGAVTYDVPFVQ